VQTIESNYSADITIDSDDVLQCRVVFHSVSLWIRYLLISLYRWPTPVERTVRGWTVPQLAMASSPTFFKICNVIHKDRRVTDAMLSCWYFGWYRSHVLEKAIL